MRGLAFLAIALVSLACGGSDKNAYHPPSSSSDATHASAKQGAGDEFGGKSAPSGAKADQVGNATWYGGAFAGKKTANGERFDPNLYTGAHRTLPFGTWVEVRRVDTGRAVRIRINDRGPRGQAIIDVSRKAAEDLDIIRGGGARVELRVVQGP